MNAVLQSQKHILCNKTKIGLFDLCQQIEFYLSPTFV
uniref:Uncharacterized protein n=1 Tax=Rhizophora mucronata TaxID=61149 RepID=A0A2P2QPP9_RHIMU